MVETLNRGAVAGMPASRTIVFHGERVVDPAARDAMADVHRHFSRERLERQVMEHERARLARELHDGILQALTGATLRLSAIDRTIQHDSERARSDIREVIDLLREHHRDLRRFISALRGTDAEPRLDARELEHALDKVRQRAAWQYSLEVCLRVRGTTIPRPMGDEIYRLVQEGLANVGKHAHARVAAIEIELAFDAVTLVLADDGVGFPLQGRFTLQQLQERRSGPASIRERVAALHGELSLESSRSGSRLDIRLPVPPR